MQRSFQGGSAESRVDRELRAPLLIPLVCFSCASHAAVCNLARIKFGASLKCNDVKPSTAYLWVALLLGYSMVSWVFFDCGLHGKWLVVIGMPIATATSAWSFRHLGLEESNVHHGDATLLGELDQGAQRAPGLFIVA